MSHCQRIFLILCFIIAHAAHAQQRSPEAADLSVFLRTSTEIDSVFVSNISQDKLFQFLRYSDTLLINSEHPINDLYNLNFFSGSNRRMNQLWLNGEKIVIRGRVNEKLVLEVDTVIGSDLYYKALDFRQRYQKLKAANEDPKVNDFLLNSFKQNNDNPFSLEIANQFFLKNVSKKEELRSLYELQVKQDTAISLHPLSPFRKIEKILLETKIDFSTFEFFNTKDQLEKLKRLPGKKYLIDFWFINCPPCVEDHKLVSAKLAELKNRNFEVVGISVDKDQREWKTYLKTKDYRWLNFREVDDFEKTARNSMLIGVFPTYVLVDENGEVIDRAFSFKEILSHLELR